MTEKEWLTADDPWQLAVFARGKVDTHRFRFLAVVWGGRIRHAFAVYDVPWYDAFAAWVEGTGPHPRTVCEEPGFDAFGYRTGWGFTATDCADAIRADNPMMAATYAGDAAAHQHLPPPPPTDFTRTHRGRSAKKRLEAEAQTQKWRDERDALRARTRVEFCDQFRDVAGNPFRPVQFEPTWRTSTADALACSMYSSRDFTAAPILADALQDAGCDDASILEHLRGPGPHVRGCWAVDLVLGKS